MPALNPYPFSPNAQTSMSQSQSMIEEAARRMGITPEAYLEREKGLKKQEDEDRLDAMNPNKSKFMSPEEKSKKLNAFKNRRFLEMGIGRVPGEY